MKVAMVLKYPIRQEMFLLEVGERYKDDLKSIKHGIKKIMEEYVETEPGKVFFEKNHKKIYLSDFANLIDKIPTDILNHYQILTCSASKVDHVVTFEAVDRLIDFPICAVFGKYNQNFSISKEPIDRLLRSVNLYDECYLFRPLLLEDKRLVGFGFISDEVLDDKDFSMDKFLLSAAETVDTISEISDDIAYENQGRYYKIINLDW